MAVIFSVVSSFSCSEKLETTFEYHCGDRVVAEFDARVEIGIEDGVLLLGEVEFYGYDANHEGAYTACHDNVIADKVRSFILNSSTQTERAFEVLSLSTPATRNNSYPFCETQSFGTFIHAYKECHSVS
ncbi:hypothetical protein [Kiloniella antarctica]|uniref:Uncharacterized protein n=1 Tax=Kiloniella antarctica TaxID=1550907 RepID=A0ABW5BLQ8_9PROT